MTGRNMLEALYLQTVIGNQPPSCGGSDVDSWWPFTVSSNSGTSYVSQCKLGKRKVFADGERLNYL